MSIMRMRRIFHRQRKIKLGKRRYSIPSFVAVVGVLLVVAFVVSAFYSFGNPQAGRGGIQLESTLGPGTVVAKVGGQNVVKGQIDAMLADQAAMFGGAPPIAYLANMRWSIFNQIADRILILQAAKREGITVSRAELEQELNAQVEQNIAQRFPTQEKLFNYLQSKNIQRDQLVRETRQQLAANVEGLREKLLVQKLQEKIEGTVQVTDDQVKNWYNEAKVSHILISPQALQEAATKPAAEGQPAPAPLTPQQAEEQAKQKAEKLLADLKGGADFATLAKENSDDPGSKEKGGDLGWVGHGQMVPEFEQAAFALQPGQLSEVVKTQFGYHILKVFETKSNLPEDFESNKEMYKQQVEMQLKRQAWQAYQAKLREGAQIQIVSAALRAQQALQEGRKEEAQTLLVQAAQEDGSDVGSRWQLAQMMIQEQNWVPAIKYLEEISKVQEGAGEPTVWMALADAYEKNKQLDEAVGAYKNASDRAGAYEYQNLGIHEQLKEKFSALNKPDLVKQEEAWLAEFEQVQKERAAEGGGMGGMMPGGMPGGTFQVP